MRTHILIIFIIIIISSGDCVCQNLIINPGFEEYSKCPQNIFYNRLYPNRVKGWSLDGFYWNKCGKYFKEPRTGNGLVELVFFTQTPYLRTFGMLGTLSSTLIKDQCYYFEMFVCLSGRTKIGIIAIDALCIGFVDDNNKLDTVRNVQIYSTKGKIISDTLNWTKISGYFNAKGNEKYIIIGGFKPRNEVNLIMINPYTNRKIIKKDYKKYAYNVSSYYIDDLLLTPVYDSVGVADSCYLNR